MISIMAWPRMLGPDEAKAYAGGDTVFNALLKMQSPLKPRVKKRGLVRYDRTEIDAALDRWKGFDA